MENFISCDWGTSNFRLRLVEKDTLKVLKTIETNDGVKNVHNRFKEQSLEKDQTSYFLDFLKNKIASLTLSSKKSIVVVSGMASSSIGMIELDYADLPFGFNSDELNTSILFPNSNLKIIVVSGVKSTSDVMRGEEIQALGLSNEMPNDEEGILILPGTHSKHIIFENGVFKDFTSYMTGELFEALSNHTILKNSLENSKWDIRYKKHFLEGVQKSNENNFLASLFNIRTNDLFQKKSSKENYYFLSGLLIGGELTYLKDSGKKIYLATSGSLLNLYKIAIETITSSSIIFEENCIDQALLIGHKKIVNTHV